VKEAELMWLSTNSDLKL